MSEKINESALLKAGEMAQQQLQFTQQVVMQRGEVMFGMWMDGLMTLVQKAQAGDRNARLALRQASKGLDEAKRIMSVLLPGEN